MIPVMEQWRDQGIVLSARPHGESCAIVSLLTENYGRHKGYVRGGQSSRLRASLEPGSVVSAAWTSRVSDNMGAYVLEQESHSAAGMLHDPLRLGALLSACALCEVALPERETHSGLYHGMRALMDTLQGEVWGAAYVIWEIALLRELGFALNLSRCAGQGDPETLIYVSPKSGHAVSEAAGAPYKEKLLILPGFLRPQRLEVTDEDILAGLRMNSHFLENWVFAQHTRGIPDERLRFEERFAKTVAVIDQKELVHG